MKKKLFLITTFIFLSVLLIVGIGEKEVKAVEEVESCESKIYYYMFMDASYKTRFDFSKGDYKRITNKYYKLPSELESGEYDVRVKSHGKIDISYDDTNTYVSKKSMTLKFVHDTLLKMTGVDSYTSGYAYNGAVFYKALPWSEDGGVTTSSATMTSDYNLFKTIVPQLGTPNITDKTTFETSSLKVGHAPTIIGVTIDGKQYNALKLTVNRTWSKSDLDPITSEEQFNVWSPAAYYVEYELCSDSVQPEPEEPEETYKLVVKHYKEGDSSKTLVSDVTKDGYKSGDSYNHTCQAIDGYEVVNTTSHPSKLTGTFSNSNITKNCYYKEKEYLLTIKYGSDENCSGTPLKESDTYKVKYKDTKEIVIPDKIDSMNNPKLGIYSTQFTTKPTLKETTLKVTMPAKNTQICIVYSPQLGVSWIYLVWVIGGLALGYSIWYFVRFFKKQNNEI